MPAVELLFFAGCPHVEAARAQLRRAFELRGETPTWREVDVSAPDAPAHAQGWGSPTVLVDGRDVLGAAPTAGLGCRLYPGSERPGAPPLAALLAALGSTPFQRGR